MDKWCSPHFIGLGLNDEIQQLFASFENGYRNLFLFLYIKKMAILTDF